MPLHPFDPPRGRFERLIIDSESLEGNLLGDPTSRVIDVYLPDGVTADSPLFVALAPFTSGGQKLHGWQSYAETLPQRLDRLIAEKKMGPVALVMPDGFTSLGGNQYIDSLAMGMWESFLIDEALPLIESTLELEGGAARRAVFGKSSGGYAAMIYGMRRAKDWGAIACQSGDMGFGMTYLPDFPKVLTALQPYGGDPAAFIDALKESDKISGDKMWIQLLLAMAASYDPDPEARYGVRLPVDATSCETIPERWQAWLRHDPLELAKEDGCLEQLRSLKGVWVDCGAQDQFMLQYPARQLSRRLREAKVEHVFEEFEGTHSSIDHRYDRTMPFLYKALSAG